MSAAQARRVVQKMRADAEVAEMRRRAPRTKLRPPHFRPWGIAVGAGPVPHRSRLVQAFMAATALLWVWWLYLVLA